MNTETEFENMKQIDYILSSRIKFTGSPVKKLVFPTDIRKKEFTNVDYTYRNKVFADASNFSFLQQNTPGNDIIGFNSRELRKKL